MNSCCDGVFGRRSVRLLIEAVTVGGEERVHELLEVLEEETAELVVVGWEGLCIRWWGREGGSGAQLDFRRP